MKGYVNSHPTSMFVESESDGDKDEVRGCG